MSLSAFYATARTPVISTGSMIETAAYALMILLVQSNGYIKINYAGRDYKAHRLAWWFMTGALPSPPLQVEHRNSDKVDNRWANLFAVTDTKNKQNPNDRLRKDNRSGCRGVWVRPDGRWRARITVDGQRIYLVIMLTWSTIAARKAAEQQYFTGHSEALAFKLRAVLGENSDRQTSRY